MLENTMIKRLEEKGFKRWVKGDMDRLYINATDMGLDIGRYKTGNISYAAWDGETISHAEGARLLGAKTYIDVKTGKLHADKDILRERAEQLFAEAEEEEKKRYEVVDIREDA